ncbi:hypothetical protein [Alteribacillus sp. HJP-4]
MFQRTLVVCLIIIAAVFVVIYMTDSTESYSAGIIHFESALQK